MTYGNYGKILLAGAALSLAACGGGGGGSSFVGSTPPPPPAPPTSVTPPPLPTGAIGLTQNGGFATVATQATFTADSNDLPQGSVAFTPASNIQFSYSAATGRYTITVPGLPAGNLAESSVNGSFSGSTWLSIHSTYNRVTQGAGPQLQPGYYVTLEYAPQSEFDYSGWGSWTVSNPGSSTGLVDRNRGVFAYGIPTGAGDVPVTGSATYQSQLWGLTNSNADIYGSATLLFDFAAGTLSGSMAPQISDGWDIHPLGTYSFRDTVFGTGSTNFSGGFNLPGSGTGGSFSGLFVGPGAAELIANWQAPYVNPFDQTQGTMAGVWRGKP